LAVLAAGGELSALSRAYSTIANLLATDLQDVSVIVKESAQTSTTSAKERLSQSRRVGGSIYAVGYEYDIYLSYPRSELVTRWILDHLLPMLVGYMELSQDAVCRSL